MVETCVRCGNQAEPTDRFCRQCGYSLAQADSSRTVLGSPKHRIIALVAGVAVVGAAGAAIGMFVTRADEPAELTSSPAVTPRPPELSGTWEGTYSYANGNPLPVSFTFAATFDSSRIGGTFMEPHTIGSDTLPTQSATVEGRYEGTEVRFSKRYPNVPPIEYEGTLDPATRTIEGRWRRENFQGTFQMTRRTAELQIVRPAAPRPVAVVADGPTVEQARSAFERRLAQDVSPSDFEIVSFEKTDGQALEVLGMRGYRLFYSAQVRFPDGHRPECVSQGGSDFRGFNCGFRFPVGGGRTRPQPVGATATFNDDLTFERRESGWVPVG